MTIQTMPNQYPDSHPIASNPVLSLKIDKVAITAPFTPSQVNFICDQVARHAETGSFKRKPDTHYRIAGRFLVPDDADPAHAFHAVFLQAGKYGKYGADLRLDWNPDHLGPIGHEHLRSLIDSIVPESFASFFQRAKLTRVDAALDIDGVGLGDVVVRGYRTRKHGVYTDQQGEAETVYIGGARNNRTVAYEKEGLLDPTGSSNDVLRIERRLVPKIQFPQILGLPNPFERLKLFATAPLVSEISGIHPDLFFDSVRLRGFGRSLKLLPPVVRRRVRKALKDPTVSIMPSTDLLWADWPELVRRIGLWPPVLDSQPDQLCR